MIRFKSFIKEELTSKQKEGFDFFAKLKGTPLPRNNVGEITASPNAIDLSKHVIPEGQDSIEIPARNDIVNDIHEHLKQHDYHEVDYANKTAYKTITLRDGATKKVGKSIGSILQATKAPQDLINRFANDNHKKSAEFSKNYKIIISRNPHHIAECSTNKEWGSCATLTDSGVPSWNNPELAGHKLPEEINHGSHVAYLVNNEDKSHQELIDNATARTILKPYVSSEGHKVLVPEDKSYIKDYKDGVTAPQGFIDTLKTFTDKHFPLQGNTVYTKNMNLYNDDGNMHKLNITNLDKPVSEDIHSEIIRNAVKTSNISKQDIHHFINNVSDTHPNKHLLDHIMLAKNFDKDHIDSLINSGKLAHMSGSGLVNLSEKPMSAENIHGIINNLNEDNVGFYADRIGIRLMKQKTINDSHIDSIINLAKDKTSSVFPIVEGITENADSNILKPKHIDKLLELNDSGINHNLSLSDNINTKHIDKLMQTDSPYIDENLSTNDNLTSNHISSLLNRHIEKHNLSRNNFASKRVLDNLVNRPDLNNDHIQTILNTKNTGHIVSLLNNTHLTDDNISDIIDQKNSYANVEVSATRSLNSQHISKLLQHHLHKDDVDSSTIIRRIAYNSRNELNTSHITDILNSEHANSGDMADFLTEKHGEKLNETHIHKILDRKYPRAYGDPNYASVAALPQLTTQHIDKLLDKNDDYANEELASRKNLNSDQIHRLIDKEDTRINSRLIGNNIADEHYQRILKHMQKNPREY